MAYRREQFRQDLRFGLRAVKLFCALAVGLLLLAGAMDLVNGARDQPLFIPWAPWLALWLVAPGTALLAALLASGMAFLLGPLRRGVLGWCLSGIVVAVGIYAAVILSLTLFYYPVGAFFLGDSSQTQAWTLFPTVTFVVVTTGAGIGTYIGMRQHTGSPVL